MIPSLSEKPAASAGAGDYRPAIDGLRAVAVLAVILFHLDRRWLPGGFVGVDVFFVVSGYLITSVILRDCERGRFSAGRFYQRRIARLLAAFVTVAVATIVGALFVYSDQDLASAGAALSASVASVANMKFMLQGNYFVLSPDAQPFLHCWSLSVEEQFYLLYPATFVLLYRKWHSRRALVLSAIGVVSFASCLALTSTRPVWAFYLLLTRAWELLAGGILALTVLTRKPLPDYLSSFAFGANHLSAAPGTLQTEGSGGAAEAHGRTLLARVKRVRVSWLWRALPFVGLLLLAVSFLAISDTAAFPGHLAALPVAGTVLLLVSATSGRHPVAAVLSSRPLVLVGRMSYSLYLWHWPVFCLLDYRFFTAPPAFRLAAKLLVTLVAATTGFYAIEQPARVFLNHPARRRLAFGALACSLLTLIPLGIAVRRSNYINAELGDVANGGLQLNASGRNGSIVLMGDSHASMYAKALAEVARERGMRLTVISVAAGDPLPRSIGAQPELWLHSLAVVRHERPDVLILACKWMDKLEGDKRRLHLALDQLVPSARAVVMITQPPVLPEGASREGIREGKRPPFREDQATRAKRQEMNRWVRSFGRDKIRVIDIEPLFSTPAGNVRFDDTGRLLYQDLDHLSVAGARLACKQLL